MSDKSNNPPAIRYDPLSGTISFSPEVEEFVRQVKAIFEGIDRAVNNPEIQRQAEVLRARLMTIQRGLVAVDAAIKPHLETISRVADTFSAAFRSPEAQELARLLKVLQSSGKVKPFTASAQYFDLAKSKLQDVGVPFLNSTDELGSLAGFTELQAIGSALQTEDGFSPGIVASLRTDLGDWRDPISISTVLAGDDLGPRFDFYRSHGFDASLTNFPSSTFQIGVRHAGLLDGLPLLMQRYGSPLKEYRNAGLDAGLERNTLAYQLLIALETALRDFIDIKMKEKYGAKWPRARLPNGMYDGWEAKNQAADDVPVGSPLINFADFTEYEKIICRDDNWNEIFRAFFDRKENIRESLQRLFPIRNATMHSRLITQEDELTLFSEMTRLMRIIVNH